MKSIAKAVSATVLLLLAVAVPSSAVAQWGSGQGNAKKTAEEAGRKAAESRKSGKNKTGKMTKKEKEEYQDFKDKGLEDSYKKGYKKGQ